jgi:putative transposase
MSKANQTATQSRGRADSEFASGSRCRPEIRCAIKQLALPLRASWGGRRAGAGRKRGPGLARVAHCVRPEHSRHHPVHVTLRSKLRCLRSQFVFPTVRLAIASLLRSHAEEFRIVQFSVQGNHVHLIVEASDRATLSSGLRSLVIRLARHVNRLLMRRGAIWADRWHARALTSPRAVRHAIVYVLANAAKHQPANAPALDPCSSAPYFDAFREFAASGSRLPTRQTPQSRSPPTTARPAYTPIPTSPPRTWLLTTGWKRHGLISISERPVT